MIWYLIVMLGGGYGAGVSITPMPSRHGCEFMALNAKQTAQKNGQLQSISTRCVGVKK